MSRNQRLIATNRAEFVTILRLGVRTLKIFLWCVNGRGRSGGQVAGGHPQKPFLGPVSLSWQRRH